MDSKVLYYHLAKCYSTDLLILAKEKCTFKIERLVVHTFNKVIKFAIVNSGTNDNLQYEVDMLPVRYQC